MRRRDRQRGSARAFGVLVAVWFTSGTAGAFPTNVPLVPNVAYSYSAVEDGDRPCITCHNNPDGGQGCVDGSGEPGKNPPCWNPFGDMFRIEHNKEWSPELAAKDADGDGFTNGQELQDPLGLWELGQPHPGTPAHVTRPGFADFTPGDADFDADGYCWFGRDLNQDGDCKDEGENAGGADDRDCDDENFLANSGAIEDCTNLADDDCDGKLTVDDEECAGVVDNDGDGFCENGQDLNGDRVCAGDEETQGEPDCNDEAPTVHPGAAVNCVDGLDNDCDELIDLDDVLDCNQRDDDGDGWCPFGQDLNGDGDCEEPDETPPGAALLGAYDCNDSVPGVNPEASEVCTDGIDNDCREGADFVDSACRHLLDLDGDGVCPAGLDLNQNGNCVGDGEQDLCPDGVCEASAVDCDDEDPLRSPSLAEDCVNLSRDVDCDGMPSVSFSVGTDSRLELLSGSDPDCSVYLDFDADGYCEVGEDGTGGVYDRDCLDAAESQGLVGDCADDPDQDGALSSPVFPEDTFELCSDGLDNDCDALPDFFDPSCFEWADRDGDGLCPSGRDLDGDGGCTGPSEATGESDCDDGDPLVSPDQGENCVDGKDNNCDGLADKLGTAFDDPACTFEVDADGDGFCPLGVDVNGDGDCLDEGERVVISDCNDDPARGGAEQHPLFDEDSPEECTDAIDNDCDGFVDAGDAALGELNYLREERLNCRQYQDRDGDTFCVRGRDRNFNASCLDAGEQAIDTSDCDDTSVAAFPGRRESCDDGIDNDCNGDVDFEDLQCPCAEDADCDDGDACSADTCNASGECVRTPLCVDAGTPSDSGLSDAGPEGGAMGDGGPVGTDGGGRPMASGGGCALTRRKGLLSAGWWMCLLGFGWTLARRRRGRRG